MIDFDESMIPHMERYAKKWVKIGLSTERANRLQAEEGIKEVWRMLEQPVIQRVLWANNPEEGYRLTAAVTKFPQYDEKRLRENMKKVNASGVIGTQCSGGLWSGYYGFYDFFANHLKIGGMEKMQLLISIGESCGWWFVAGQTAVCVERPIKMVFNEKTGAHCADGPSIQYPDGWAIYVLNGITVPEYLVMTPGHLLDPKCILSEKNASVRSEIEKKIGPERILSGLGGKLIDKWHDPAIGEWCDYELYELTIPGMSVKPHMLKMRNPSEGIYECNWADSRIRTVKEELARRNGNKVYVQPESIT